MRIVIATGIYPPEIGGPAFYAQNLAEALKTKGHEVEIGTFGPLRKLPTIIRHFTLFVKMLPKIARCDVVISLDTFSAALPAHFAAALFGKRHIIRTGGDFIWEQYIERTGDLLPLPFFYEKHKPFSLKEKIYLALTKYIVHRSEIVFSSHFQKNIWMKVYGIDEKKVRVIENAITEKIESLPPERKNFLFYGRDIKIRNKKKLLEAFQIAKKTVPNIVLETGQIPQADLIEKIRRGYAVIMPSISDITPNYILDALRCGKPFILTCYSEYATRYVNLGLTVDPLDAGDMAAKLIEMCDDATYAGYVERIKNASLTRTYADLADDFCSLIATT